MTFLVFDRSSKRLTAYSEEGPSSVEAVDSWRAANVVDSTSNGQWAHGYYRFSHPVAPETATNARYGSYGAAGRLEFAEVPYHRVAASGIPPTVDDCPTGVRTGMQIHSGKEAGAGYPQNRGVDHPTFGCIRVADQTVRDLLALNRADHIDGMFVVSGASNFLLNTSGSGAADVILLTRGGDCFGGGGNDYISAQPAGAVDVDGGAGDDKIFGGDGDDVLRGAAGRDSIDGGDGDDTLHAAGAFNGADAAGNVVFGGAGDDDAFGSGAADTLYGGDGADLLQGGNGNDLLCGDLSLANYQVATGWGRYITTADNDARVAAEARGDDDLRGGAGNDVLFGGGGKDKLAGEAGADTMYGGSGNDSYTVDNTGDVIRETSDAGDRKDAVSSSVTFTLAANVEELYLTGRAAINATGNAAANLLQGNDARNVLNGLAGADTMTGGLGDDTYHVDNAGDRVVERAGQGTDTVVASLSMTLGANLENLTLTGTAALTGRGNAADNQITGNDGDNRLTASGGTDVLRGGRGNDVLYASADFTIMHGGEGFDQFVFSRGGPTGGPGSLPPTHYVADFQRGVDKANYRAFAGLDVVITDGDTTPEEDAILDSGNYILVVTAASHTIVRVSDDFTHVSDTLFASVVMGAGDFFFA